MVIVLASGCPVQASVHASGLDERTGADGHKRAGTQCQRVHPAIVAQAKGVTTHVHADEIREKARTRVISGWTWRLMSLVASGWQEWGVCVVTIPWQIASSTTSADDATGCQVC